GTFRIQPRSQLMDNLGSAVVGDFDGDGHADLAILNEFSGVSVLLGTGHGTFQAPARYQVSSNPIVIVVGDFNGDGRPDLAVAEGCFGELQGVFVLLGTGDGTFQARRRVLEADPPGFMVVGDFNGDGRPDLAVGSASFQADVSVWLGNGDGTFRFRE